MLLRKITDINQIAFNLMAEGDTELVVKKYTEECVEILNADFGFSWGKFGSNKYRLIYKSPNISSNPIIPRRKSSENTEIVDLLFDNKVKKDNYEGEINPLIKSYVIIPIRYGDHVYGSIVICYKKEHKFTREELALATILGNTITHVITVNWLLEHEQKSLALVEKQKEVQVLLDQEKLKSKFIENATHEFRTPLAIMRGNVDLALGGKGFKKMKSPDLALKEIRGEINHLSELLSDLATIISSESQEKKAFHVVNFDLVELINKIIKRVHVLVNKKKIKVKLTTDAKEIFINGNKESLEKLFLNLIRNATIYGKEKGKIDIDIKKEKNQVIVKVADNGIGISKEELPHIFERFFRTEEARNKSSIGTGLGLAIAKWAADSHGGTINVESTPGVGSTFTVTLPIN